MKVGNIGNNGDVPNNEPIKPSIKSQNMINITDGEKTYTLITKDGELVDNSLFAQLDSDNGYVDFFVNVICKKSID